MSGKVRGRCKGRGKGRGKGNVEFAGAQESPNVVIFAAGEQVTPQLEPHSITRDKEDKIPGDVRIHPGFKTRNLL